MLSTGSELGSGSSQNVLRSLRRSVCIVFGTCTDVSQSETYGRISWYHCLQMQAKSSNSLTVEAVRRKAPSACVFLQEADFVFRMPRIASTPVSLEFAEVALSANAKRVSYSTVFPHAAAKLILWSHTFGPR